MFTLGLSKSPTVSKNNFGYYLVKKIDLSQDT